jgi:hypothetical protein
METDMSSTLVQAPKRRSAMQVLSQWWQAWTRSPTALSDPNCYLEGEVERVARDIGVPAAEIRQLVAHGEASASLLIERMAELKLDRNKIAHTDSETFRDMQRVCTLCDSRPQCSFDLALGVKNENWQDYCPNVATLKMLLTAVPPANNRR